MLNRFSSFLDRPTIHNIVSQPNRIDFHRIMREGKIFLANLEKGGLQDAAYVLGSFILSRLQLAALARRPGERKLFPILVDEFHNFAGTGMDTESIETFLSEARSYRVPLVVATQYVGRLNRGVVTALFANVGTMAALHLGQIDAQPLARELGEFTVEDLLNLEVGEAVVRMGSAQDAFNVKVPLALEQESQREEIIALSRERYCKPRRDVEKLLAGDPERLPPEPQSSASGLTPDEAHFLEYVASNPDVSLSKVATFLGLGTTQGQGGHRARYGVLTRAGLKALGMEARSGQGGPVYRHYQALIRQLGETRGYRAIVEHPLAKGAAVDVHLKREGLNVAVEVSITSSNEAEVKNIIQAIEAGYEEVLCLFLEEERISEIQPTLSIFFTQTHWNESCWPRSVGSRTTCEMYEGRTEINCEHPELY